MIREMSAIDYWLILCLLGLFALSEKKAHGQTPQEYLDLFDGASQAIKSFDLVVNGVYRSYIVSTTSMQKADGRERLVATSRRKLLPNESPQTFQVNSRQVYQRGRGRMEPLPGGTTAFVKRFLVYDGEIEKGWTPSQHTATIARPASPPAGPDGMDYREGYLTVIGHAPYLRCFRERGNIRVERKSDGKLVTLHSDPVTKKVSDFPSWGLRLTLDPQHGFMPVILETLQTIDGKPIVDTRRTVTNWKDLGGGAWAPTRVVTQHMELDIKFPETFGQVNSEVVLEVDLNRSSWNQDISDETFELQLPKGTTVVDHLRNVRYVTGEDDPGKNLDSLAAHALDLVPINTWLQKPSNPWLQRGLIGGPILLLALIGFWIFVRRRRKRIAGV